MNYIYLHGFASGANSFKGTFFKKKFAQKKLILHTPDLNNGDFEHMTISRELAIIDRIANVVEGDITLIGSSLGGYLGALYAQDNERVKKLVILASAFQFVTHYKERMGEELLNEWKTRGKINIFHHGYKTERELHYQIVEDAEQHDSRELRRSLPTLIIHGLNDDSVPYQYSIDYLRSNPKSQLLLFNSDHTLTNDVDTIWHYMELFLKI
jgi:pimeloyl-ACP methyl ester carboxylesterase